MDNKKGYQEFYSAYIVLKGLSDAFQEVTFAKESL